MTRIVVVRHGQTEWNLARRIQGRTDNPLNATGREQAAAAADALAGRGEWRSVITSPLVRARETGELIAARLAVPLESPAPLLTERECGEAEGLPVAEAYERWPDRQYPGAETFADLGVRVAAALTRFDDGAIVVGHGQALRWGLQALLEHPIERLANGQPLVIALVADRWRLEPAASASDSVAR